MTSTSADTLRLWRHKGVVVHRSTAGAASLVSRGKYSTETAHCDPLYRTACTAFSIPAHAIAELLSERHAAPAGTRRGPHNVLPARRPPVVSCGASSATLHQIVHPNSFRPRDWERGTKELGAEDNRGSWRDNPTRNGTFNSMLDWFHIESEWMDG